MSINGRGTTMAVALAFSLAACVADSGARPPQEHNSPTVTPTATADPQDTDRNLDFDARVTVSVSGEVAIEWAGKLLVNLSRVGGPGQSANVLTVGTWVPEVVGHDPKTRFRWAFDLINTYNDKPGTFLMPGQPTGGGLRNTMLLLYMRVVDDKQGEQAVFKMEDVEMLREHTQIVEPCILEIISEDARTGRLDCPALRAKQGGTVHVNIHWQPWTADDNPSTTPSPSP